MAAAAPAVGIPWSSSVNLHSLHICRKTRRSPISFRTITCSSRAHNTGLLDAAAKHTVDSFIESGMVVGLGSGLASGMAIQYLGQQLRLGAIRGVVGIPTSVDSASEAAKAGIPLDHFQDSCQIDFAFNDVDIIEEETLISVIGCRRLQWEETVIEEKNILEVAKKLVFIVTEKQYKGGLEGSVPVIVKSHNWMEIAEEIDDLFLGDAEVWRRSSIGHAGPTGGDFPFFTKEGYNVLDLIFTSPMKDLAEVARSLDNIVGVVDHGIISKIPCAAVIASEDGLSVVENSPSIAEKTQ